MIRLDPNILAVLLPLGMACYFVPSLIVYLRGHCSMVAIFALNLLLGWTGVGWVGALIWAMYKPLYY
jgi:hypothetical protein